MTSPVQIQTWKLRPEVTEYMKRCAEAQMATEPPGGRANFYPEGAMMYNGGQGAGDGGRQILFDTEEQKVLATGKPKELPQEAPK